MNRVPVIKTRIATSDKAKQLLEAVHTKLTITPNMTLVMASSPALLEEYLTSSGVLAGDDDCEAARKTGFSMWL